MISYYLDPALFPHWTPISAAFVRLFDKYGLAYQRVAQDDADLEILYTPNQIWGLYQDTPDLPRRRILLGRSWTTPAFFNRVGWSNRQQNTVEHELLHDQGYEHTLDPSSVMFSRPGWLPYLGRLP